MEILDVKCLVWCLWTHTHTHTDTHTHTHTHDPARDVIPLTSHCRQYSNKIKSIYIFLRCSSPQMARDSLSRLHDHTQLKHTTLGRTALEEWSARRRDLYLTSHNTHKREKTMSPAGFEIKFPASERAAADPRLRMRGNWDRLKCEIRNGIEVTHSVCGSSWT